MMRVLVILCIYFASIVMGQEINVAVMRNFQGLWQLEDMHIWQGVNMWANWTNAKGGIDINGTKFAVKLTDYDTSAPDIAGMVAKIKTVTTDLITVQNYSYIVCPYASTRALAFAQVGQLYRNVTQLVPAGATDLIWVNGWKYVWGAMPRASLWGKNQLQFAFEKKAKTFAILYKVDSYAISQTTAARNIILQNGGTIVYDQNYTSLAGQIGFTAVLEHFTKIKESAPDVDVLCVGGLQEDITVLASALKTVELSPKLAIILSNLAIMTSSDMQITENWIGQTLFQPSLKYGTSGKLMGTASEFAKLYNDTYNERADYLVSGGAVMGLLLENALVKSKSQDIDRIRDAMLTTDYEYFYGRVQYNKTIGTSNDLKPVLPVIIKNGDFQVVYSSSEIVYPTNWPWLAVNNVTNTITTKGKGLSTPQIAGIAVGISVGVMVIIVVAGFFIHKQRRIAASSLQKLEKEETKNYKINFADIHELTLIGAGNFGQVFRAEWKGADVAVKRLKNQNMNGKQLAEFTDEVGVMVGLRHPNILLFMGACNTSPNLCILTEYMPRGNLFDILEDETNTLPLSFVLDIIKGIQFIHSNKMLHRDLKSPNILVDKRWTCKVADFGLTCLSEINSSSSQVSLLWTAPEILQQQPYTEAADIYAFGIILWELFTRKVPFEGFSAAAVGPAVVAGKRPAMPDGLLPVLSQITQECWAQNPESRPTAPEIRRRLEAVDVPNDLDASFSPTRGNSSSSRAKAAAVPAPTGEVFIASLKIANFLEFWEWNSSAMFSSLLVYIKVLQRLLSQHKGYLVSNEGERCTVVFQAASDAGNFCINLQLELCNQEWPKNLYDNAKTIRVTDASGTCIWNGLRVAAGLHLGTPRTSEDSLYHKTIYSGPCVEETHALVKGAIPGQTIVSQKAMDVLIPLKSVLMPHFIEPLGMKTGVPETVYQLASDTLKTRRFEDALTMESFQATPRVTPEKWVLSFEEIKLGNKLGTGSYGEVYRAGWKGQEVAVKLFLRQKLPFEGLLDVYSESSILRKLDHKNIVKFMGACVQPPNICIVTQLANLGNLSKLLHSNETISWDRRIKFVRDIAEGMAYLHSHNIIHRDLKTPNLVVDSNYQVKITDFGFSRIKEGNQTMTQCGTVSWTAPEIFDGSKYNEKADVYSFGVVMWEILTRQVLWKGMHAIKITTLVTSGEHPPYSQDNSVPSSIWNPYVQLMERCWSFKPEARPSFDEICATINNIH